MIVVLNPNIENEIREGYTSILLIYWVKNIGRATTWFQPWKSILDPAQLSY